MSHQTASKKKVEKRSPSTSASPVDEGKVEATPQPVLRVSLLGPFVVEQADGTRLNLDALLGRQQSSALLKLLLCHPDRRVSRDQISEALWPGQPPHIMEGSLSVAKSLLKTRLDAVCGQPLMPRVSGEPPCYSLADQTVIWTDLDAVEQHIHQAVHITDAQEALAGWEQAFFLLQRGELLADDQAAYWYQADLVQDRRKRLSRLRTHCVFRIVDLALACDDVSRALNTLFLARDLYPTHEEIVFRLMEVLAQQGQIAEALRHYSLFETALLESNAEPREETRLFAYRLRAGKLLEDRAEGGIGSAHQTTDKEEEQLAVTSPLSGWEEAPYTEQFYGRERELATLRSWVVDDQCRLVAILGMGGMGKTSLAVVLTSGIQDHFEYVFWCSLQNAPPFITIMQECMKCVSDQQQVRLPEDGTAQISLLLACLREHRCLLVFDNCESILQAGSHAGQYREGYEEYGRLFQRIGGTRHQSCLLMTSREKPKEVALLEGNSSPVRSYHLHGLGLADGRKILEDKGLIGTEERERYLINHYTGNPLALKLVAQFISEVFDGDIDEFLKDGERNFSDIRDVLQQQFERLSELEQEIMYWLAVEREKRTLGGLQEDIIYPVSKLDLQEGLRSLRRRCLVEASTTGFTLQNVLMEYVTNRLVDHIYEEIVTERLLLCKNLALVKAQSKDYVRESQVRLILAPVAQRLQATLGQEELEKRCQHLLLILREMGMQPPNYAAGNILNLLIHLRCDLQAYDFSRLVVQQAYLQDISLSDVSFAYSYLTKCVFTDTFGTALTLAFSPGGDLLATGSSNGEVRVWHTQGVTPLRINRGHTNGIRSVAFSSDETLLASGSEDHTVRLWEADSGQWLRSFQGHEDRVYSVAFSPDGTVLASGSEDHTVRLWHVSTGKCLKILKGHASSVRAVAFSPDGTVLASGSDDRTIRLWHAIEGQCIKTFEGHKDAVYLVIFSSDGAVLTSGSKDQSVRQWDVGSGECLKFLSGCGSRVSMAFHPDKAILASSDDEIVRLWNAESGQHLGTLEGHTSWVRAVSFSLDGVLLASSSEEPNVRLWDVRKGQCLHTLQGYAHQVWTVAFSGNGRILASGGEDHIVRIWNASTGVCLYMLQGHTSRVRSVTFSPDGYTLVSGSEDQTIRLWDVGSGRCLKVLRGHTDWIYSVAVSFEGQAIASGGEDHEVHLWNMRAEQQLTILQGHTNRVRSVAFSPDGQTLASGSEDQTIRIWNVDNGQCLKILRGHSDRIYSVAFSSDGRVLASSSDDQTIRLWDILTGECLQVLRGHTDRIRSVAFHSDDALLASGSSDQTVRLWDIRSGQCLHVLQGHTDHVRAVSFSSDGQLLASGSHDGTIKLWGVYNGQLFQTLRGDRPYERMNITGVTGLTEAQKAALRALGAIDELMPSF